MVVLYVDFEKLCWTEDLFQIKVLKQQVDYAKALNGVTDIRLKQDRKYILRMITQHFVLKILKYEKISCRTENFQRVFLIKFKIQFL